MTGPGTTTAPPFQSAAWYPIGLEGKGGDARTASRTAAAAHLAVRQTRS